MRSYDMLFDMRTTFNGWCVKIKSTTFRDANVVISKTENEIKTLFVGYFAALAQTLPNILCSHIRTQTTIETRSHIVIT
jgi:hypothetical protein